MFFNSIKEIDRLKKGSGIPELENRSKKPSYALWRHKTKLSQIDVITKFSLIFRDSQFLMKIKFPSYLTRKFHLYLMIIKFPSHATQEFKFHWKFRVISLKESFESLRKVLRKQLWLAWISGFLFDKSAYL